MQEKKVNVLGVNISGITFDEALKRAFGNGEKDSDEMNI